MCVCLADWKERDEAVPARASGQQHIGWYDVPPTALSVVRGYP
jgi:hypothetical protein